jgi:TPR repeat protein
MLWIKVSAQCKCRHTGCWGLQDIRAGCYHDPVSSLQTAAFKCFMIASRAGHAAASVNVAWYLATGTLRGVARDVELAVR